MKRCPLCGSSKIIPDLQVEDGESYPSRFHRVHVDRHPKAMLMRDPVESRLLVSVCGSCGFASLFAEDPELLYMAYMQQSGEDEW